MRRAFILIPAVVLVAAIGTSHAWWAGPTIDRVEEDWQLVIGTPDFIGAGPQITTYMSPTSDGSSPFALFNVNYRDQPSFSAGGLQTQIWNGKQIVSYSGQRSAQCNTAGETITWTQRLSLSGGSGRFEVEGGQSTTWGQFGQGDNLDLSFNTSVTSLSGYDPDISAAKSQVGWEPNRVTSLTLTQVRYYSNGQLIGVDTTPRSVTLQ